MLAHQYIPHDRRIGRGGQDAEDSDQQGQGSAEEEPMIEARS